MLTPIPRRILRDTMTLTVPSGFDRYQAPTGSRTYVIRNVHFQGDNITRKTTDNTEVQLRGTIWIDARYSFPKLDYEALQDATQAAGGVMTCTIKGPHGNVSRPMTILTVDGLPDDEDNLHHWELEVY